MSNTSIPNGIIAALQAGYANRNQKQKLAQDKEAEQARHDEESKRMDEQQREFNLTHAAVKAMNDLQVLKDKQAIGTQINQQTIPTPLEGSIVKSVNKDNQGNIQSTVYNHPTLGDYTVLDPTYRAQQQAASTQIENQPAYNEKQTELQMAQDSKAQDLQMNLDAARERAKDTNALRLEIAKMTGSSKEDVARINAENRANLLDIKNTLLQGKVSDADKDKYDQLDDIQEQATDLQKIMQNGGLKYYSGTGMAGTLNNVLKNVVGHEDQPVLDSTGKAQIDPLTNKPITYKDIRTKVGQLQSTLAQERFKSRFTTAEQNQLNSYVPSPDRTLAPDAVTSQLNNLINATSKQKMQILSPRLQRGTPQQATPQQSAPVASPVQSQQQRMQQLDSIFNPPKPAVQTPPPGGDQENQ